MVPDEALRLWRTLAGDEDAFRPAATTVVRGSRGFCPPGWTGVVRLGDAVAIEVGNADDEAIARLRGLADPCDPAQVGEALAPVRTLGPGQLAYLPVGSEVADLQADGELDEVEVGAVRDWLATIPVDDVDESSVAEMERVVVLRRRQQVVGAAGHLLWPTDVAHLGVLVTPDARGAGVGACLGAAATRRALRYGLTPQWRAAAANASSRQIAQRIGYREAGRQFSFQLAREADRGRLGADRAGVHRGPALPRGSGAG